MSERPHILVVDDDARLRVLLKDFLSSKGYRVTAAPSALAANTMMSGLSFDAMVLDVMMPGESGLAFIKRLRGNAVSLPVLMLSALAESGDRISGLESGSDDYLAKPFEPQELLLRLQSLLRRSQAMVAEYQRVSFGPFTFEIRLGELLKSGKAVKLTTSEKDILRLLVRASGKVVSRDELAGGESLDATRKVDVQINRLRQKIEDEPSMPRYLQTVRGQGYALLTGRADG